MLINYGKISSWLDSSDRQAAKEELLSISANEKEIEDRFYKDLEFGTAGIRNHRRGSIG